MRFRVFGVLEVRRDGGVLDIGGRQSRLVLGALLAADGRSVSGEQIADLVWGEAPPPSAQASLQSYVSRLRRVLGAAGDPPVTIALEGAGYVLDVAAEDVDARVFERLASEGERLLDAGDPLLAEDVLRRAVELVRGPAFGDLGEHPFFEARAAGLRERWLHASEDRFDASLELGRLGELVGDLTHWVATNPLRERPRSLLALALYRSGRQADALAVLADGARLLRDELGIEADPRLRELETRILRQDPSLDLARPTAPSLEGASAAADAPRAAATPNPLLRGPSREGQPLVGRTDELAQLVAALDEAANDARFVVVEGDPGIGKTRLVEELRAIAFDRGCFTAWGRSDESGATPGLWPWLRIFEALDAVAEGRSDPGAPEDSPRLLSVVADDEDHGGTGAGIARRHARFEAVADRLEAEGVTQPAVVVLDDLQWADPTSLDLLSFLATRLRSGVVVIVTVRIIDHAHEHAEAIEDALAELARHVGSRRLVLAGLAREATRALLPSATTGPIDDATADAIHARSEGNPFYSLELAKLLSDEHAKDSAIPANVRDVLRRRLRTLPDETRDLLAVGAVMGRDVDMHLLATASGLERETVLERLDPALLARWLVAVEGAPFIVRFQHALNREVLVDGLSALQRARLHLRVAEAIEARGAGTDEVEILAEHLWHAMALIGPERAAESLERAAEVALSRVSYASAEHQLRRAWRLRRAASVDDGTRRRELTTLLRFLEVVLATRYFGGVDEDALARAQQLAVEFEDDDLERTLFWYQWAAMSVGASHDTSVPLAQTFFDRYSQDTRPQVSALAWQLMATGWWTAGKITESVGHFDRAVELLAPLPEPISALDIEQRLVANTFWGALHALHGDWTAQQTFDHFEALLATWPPVAASSICGFAATAACYLGRWDLVGHYARRALVADPASQFDFWGGQFLMHRAIALASEGHLDGAYDSFCQGRARYLAVSARSALPTFGGTVAMLLAEHGDIARAQELLIEARETLLAWGERWNEPCLLLSEAIVAAHAGNLDTSRAAFESAIEVAERQGAHRITARARTAMGELLGTSLQDEFS